MKLENQVCSLKYAKKLKELGVKQESYWYYNSKTKKIQQGFTSHTDIEGFCRWSVSAFTVAELGEMLPFSIRVKITNKIVHTLIAKQFKIEGSYSFGYLRPGGSIASHFEDADTEANVRAKLRIYLIEEGLVKC